MELSGLRDDAGEGAGHIAKWHRAGNDLSVGSTTRVDATAVCTGSTARRRMTGFMVGLLLLLLPH